MANEEFIVYIVDDDLLVSRALVRLLSSAGYQAKSFPNAEDFLLNHEPEVPGCAIIDLNLPGMDGLRLQEALTAGPFVRPSIFLTGHGDIPTSVNAMKGGAVDFLTKPVDSQTLLAAVAQALEQDAAMRRAMEARRSVEQRIAKLTPRERQVLFGVLAGQLNKQIAGDLGTAEKTIKVHRGRMMEKMGVRAVADLVRLMELVQP